MGVLNPIIPLLPRAGQSNSDCADVPAILLTVPRFPILVSRVPLHEPSSVREGKIAGGDTDIEARNEARGMQRPFSERIQNHGVIFP